MRHESRSCREEKPESKRMCDLQSRKSRKVPIHCVQTGNPVFHAERGDVGVVNQIARGPRLAESLQQDSEVRGAVANHHQRWRFPKPFQTLDCFLRIAGRVEDAWMGDDPKKLVSARYCRWIGLFRQSRNQLHCLAMKNVFRPCRIDRNIHIERDQRFPSIRSKSTPRFSRTTPG